MTVYVDTMEAPYRRMIMCHMFADTLPELLEMATKINVQHKWLQHTGNASWVHFDIGKSKKELALKHGAVLVEWRDTPAYAWCQHFEPTYAEWY